jgi:hypothetical protein
MRRMKYSCNDFCHFEIRRRYKFYNNYKSNKQIKSNNEINIFEKSHVKAKYYIATYAFTNELVLGDGLMMYGIACLVASR